MALVHRVIVGGAMLCAASVVAPHGAQTARADSFLFDLEDQALSDPGSQSTLTLTQGDLTLDLTRPGGSFSIADFSASDGTIAFGTRSILPDEPAVTTDEASPQQISEGLDPFVVNFSKSVTSFSVQVGDFGGDEDTLTLVAWSGLNGSGDELASDTKTLVGIDETFSFASLLVEGIGIQSVQFIGGGGAGGDGVLYDNLAATTPVAVPLPAAAFMIPLAAALAGYCARRLRRA